MLYQLFLYNSQQQKAENYSDIFYLNYTEIFSIHTLLQTAIFIQNLIVKPLFFFI